MTRPPLLSRRTFLTSSGLALTAGALGPFGIERANAMPLIPLPTTRAARRQAPSAFLPAPPSAEELRRLALAAMDAAKSAGADFADVRVGVQRGVAVPPFPYYPGASLEIGYGVRAYVNGTWGFQYGNLLSADAMTSAARSAVAGAQRYAATNQRLGRTNAIALAPTPVATGEWHGPSDIDPFNVPLDDYYRVIDTLQANAPAVYRNVRIGGGTLGWHAETRVFASTDGALVTQYFMRGGPAMKGTVIRPDTGESVDIQVDDRWITSGGFEVAFNTDWIEYFHAGVEEARRVTELPFRPFRDVGRFPIIFDGASFGNLIGTTLSEALDSDRASGAEADAGGSTFLASPDDVLGASVPQFSPLLTVRADRALPYLNATGWDDEGVVPEPYTLIDRGRVVDYHTTRTTAPRLAAWYAKRGEPMRAHGTAISTLPTDLPRGTPGHLSVAPASGRASLDDLAREIQHGFIMRGTIAGVEAGLSLATIQGSALEVQRGKIVGTTSDITLQLVTKKIFTGNLVAIGDAGTVRTVPFTTNKGVPPRQFDQPVSAPAALCKDVDVVTWLNG